MYKFKRPPPLREAISRGGNLTLLTLFKVAPWPFPFSWGPARLTLWILAWYTSRLQLRTIPSLQLIRVRRLALRSCACSLRLETNDRRTTFHWRANRCLGRRAKLPYQSVLFRLRLR